MALSEWVDEMLVEVDNDKADTGVVIHKRKGTTDVGRWYATMTVGQWEELIKEAGY